MTASVSFHQLLGRFSWQAVFFAALSPHPGRTLTVPNP